MKTLLGKTRGNRIIHWALLATAAAVAALTLDLPAPAAADSNVQVNTVGGVGTPETLRQEETTIVEFDYDDPADSPDRGRQDVILVAWNDLNAGANRIMGYGRSLDGTPFQHGSLAASGHVPPPFSGVSRGDPVLAVDRHAGLDGLNNPLVYLTHLASLFGQLGVWVAQSTDGGRTFPQAAILNGSNNPVVSTAACNQTGDSCDDKPWIAVDQRGGPRPPDGNTYLCWTRYGVPSSTPYTTQILLSQRLPGGTFGPAIPITPVRTFPAFVQGCQVAVDTEGHVYVSWLDFLNDATNTPALMIRHAAPPSGAATIAFDPPVLVQQIRGASAGVPAGVVSCAAPNWLPVFSTMFNFTYDYVMNFPSLATNPYDGDVYLAWSMWNGPFASDGPRRFDVFFKRAFRPATYFTWFARRRVNDDSATQTDQYMPALTTYPLPVFPLPTVSDVGVKVQWHDKRNSSANNGYQLFADESPFTANTLVSDGGVEPMAPTGTTLRCRLGDYNGITSGDLEVGSPDGGGPGTYFLHAWTDTRNNAAGDPEVFFQSQSFDAGSVIDIPRVFTDLRLVYFLAPQQGLTLPVGFHAPVQVVGLVRNAGPEEATAGTWLAGSAPPEVGLSWEPGRDDLCFGPAPPDLEGPFTPTVGIACHSGPMLALAMEHVLAPGQEVSVQRNVDVACLAKGSFQVDLRGGTGPTLPDDVEDADLSNNGLNAVLFVNCVPDPRPPAPANLIWVSDLNLVWNPVPEAGFYRLHRGTPEALPALRTNGFDSCLRLSTLASDAGGALTEIPPVGSLFWYLVTAVDAEGDESGAGVGRTLNSLGDCSFCGHVTCATDGPLSPNCNDPCIGQICQSDPHCCTTRWDSVCVEEVRTRCSSLVCPDSAGSCAHGLCVEGPALVPGCDDPPVVPSCVSAICNQDAYCCNGAWDGLCVAEVQSVCGFGCD